MSKRKFKNKRDSTVTPKSYTAIWLSDSGICLSGYTPLDHNPEIMAACRKIATILSSATIHLMSNTENGDIRIVNELSRAIDIDPMPTMTRATWMEAIVMNLLLYGKGNSIVVPHTWKGLLQSLEPISASRVSFLPAAGSFRDYKVLIDARERDPQSVLHFVYNPDPVYLWKGRGLTVSLQDLADNLKQAAKTEKAFMSSEYKPSIIVKVDALTDEFSSPEGRQKLLDSYVKPAKTGDPWLIPAEQFEVEQVKPLTLADLAISDTVQLNKKTVAALFGVPAFVLGVGDYRRDEWNMFIQSTIMPIAKSIAMEMTKKLILNLSWYLTFNVWSLMDYDLKATSDVLLAGADRGFVNGDEWRDRMHMSPAGLKEYKILENYIPYDMSGNQSKLTGGGE
ncbi:MAG: phage portal protein [Oscillospiraceae bacterium]|nr:phage portal protein [Oscillospiraceae bacterium]